MISLELTSESDTYLIDVVHQKFRKPPDTEWRAYHEVIGSKVGECFTIVLVPNQDLIRTTKIKSIRFV